MRMLGLDLAERHAHARQVAELLRLPLRRRAWRGLQGNWQGIGTGSSLDFQDHRPYASGDDPRYINWQAFARSGHYSMKLYRQEVSPALDLVVDVSSSMFVDQAKAARTADLLYFCAESALQTGASLRCHRLLGSSAEAVALDELLAHTWRPSAMSAADPAALGSVPWRHGSMRVLVSDLLWPGSGLPVCALLGDASAFGIILAPFSRGETEPDWAGNLEIEDCESAQRRSQRVDRDVVARYRAAYAQHFELWDEQAIRHRVLLARIPAEPELAEALRQHAAEVGAVEWSR